MYFTNAAVESWFRWIKSSVKKSVVELHIKSSRMVQEQLNCILNRTARVLTEQQKMESGNVQAD
jgi:hypothetical protein